MLHTLKMSVYHAPMFQQLACETFDKKKDGCKLIRLSSSFAGKECDPPAKSASLHIVAVQVDKYEIRVDI